MLIESETLKAALIFNDKTGEITVPNMREVFRVIDSQPPFNPWHRVEEPPEKDEWVLTITKSYKGARIYNIATVDSDGRWWTPSQNGMREIHYIEYWMPIEPPKEDA